MRNTIVAGIFIIFAAIIGVLGSTHYKEWAKGPSEGIFSVELSSFRKVNIPSAIRDQIQHFPCFLKIVHIDGPSIKDLTVKVESKTLLDKFSFERNDENVEPFLSKDKKSLQLNIPVLRKGSVIHYNFSSFGEPTLERKVIMSQGRLIDQIPVSKKRPWYKNEWAIIPFAIFLIVIFTVVIDYSIGKASLFPPNLDLPKHFRKLAILAAIIAFIPFLNAFSIAFLIYMIFLSHSQLKEISESSLVISTQNIGSDVRKMPLVESSGEHTVLLSENFDNFEGWSKLLNGEICHSNDFSHTGSYCLKKFKNNDPNGGYKEIGKNISRGFVLSGWLYRPSGKVGGPADRLAVTDAKGTGYGFAVSHLDNQIKFIIERRVENRFKGNLAVKNLTNYPGLLKDEWYYFEFQVPEGADILLSIDHRNQRIIHLSASDDKCNNFSRINIHGGHVYYVDDLVLAAKI